MREEGRGVVVRDVNNRWSVEGRKWTVNEEQVGWGRW